MINVDFKKIEMIPSAGGGGEYDDTQIKADIANLNTNKLSTNNIIAGDNIAVSTSGNNVTIASTASSGSNNAGIRLLHYKWDRNQTIGNKLYPIFVADDYSNLTAGDIYVIKIDWGEIIFPINIDDNLFFPPINFPFTTFEGLGTLIEEQQQGSGHLKSFFAELRANGGSNEKLYLGNYSDTEYEPSYAFFKVFSYC